MVKKKELEDYPSDLESLRGLTYSDFLWKIIFEINEIGKKCKEDTGKFKLEVKNKYDLKFGCKWDEEKSLFEKSFFLPELKRVYDNSIALDYPFDKILEIH